MFVQKHNISNAWRGILDNAGAIRCGVRMEIGNGHNTLFWHHAWVSNTLLSQFSIQPIPQHLIDSAVDEFWDYDKGWKWEEFMELISDEVCQRNTSFVISPGLNNRDHLILEGSSSGKFSLKSTMNLLHATIHEAEDPFWNLVWKCPASQRMRFFLWLTALDKLMSN